MNDATLRHSRATVYITKHFSRPDHHERPTSSLDCSPCCSSLTGLRGLTNRQQGKICNVSIVRLEPTYIRQPVVSYFFFFLKKIPRDSSLTQTYRDARSVVFIDDSTTLRLLKTKRRHLKLRSGRRLWVNPRHHRQPREAVCHWIMSLKPFKPWSHRRYVLSCLLHPSP